MDESLPPPPTRRSADHGSRDRRAPTKADVLPWTLRHQKGTARRDAATSSRAHATFQSAPLKWCNEIDGCPKETRDS